jgi:hypothetical protein
MTDKQKKCWEKIKTESDYYLFKQSGMFFELFPELTGDWEADCVIMESKVDWVKRVKNYKPMAVGTATLKDIALKAIEQLQGTINDLRSIQDELEKDSVCYGCFDSNTYPDDFPCSKCNFTGSHFRDDSEWRINK